MTNIIKINQRHEYKGSTTYFLLLPNYVWMYILIFNNEPYVAHFRFTPKFKLNLKRKGNRELMDIYTEKEVKKILDYLSKAAETTVDTINFEKDGAK